MVNVTIGIPHYSLFTIPCSLPARRAVVAASEISAAAAAAIASKAPAPAAATSAIAAIFSRSGFIDRQVATVKVCAIELLNCLITFFLRRHFYEAETTRATRVAIFNDGSGFYRPYLGEELLQVITRSLKGQIPNVKFDRHRIRCFPSPLTEER